MIRSSLTIKLLNLTASVCIVCVLGLPSVFFPGSTRTNFGSKTSFLGLPFIKTTSTSKEAVSPSSKIFFPLIFTTTSLSFLFFNSLGTTSSRRMSLIFPENSEVTPRWMFLNHIGDCTVLAEFKSNILRGSTLLDPRIGLALSSNLTSLASTAPNVTEPSIFWTEEGPPTISDWVINSLTLVESAPPEPETVLTFISLILAFFLMVALSTVKVLPLLMIMGSSAFFRTTFFMT